MREEGEREREERGRREGEGGEREEREFIKKIIVTHMRYESS